MYSFAVTRQDHLQEGSVLPEEGCRCYFSLARQWKKEKKVGKKGGQQVLQLRASQVWVLHGHEKEEDIQATQAEDVSAEDALAEEEEEDALATLAEEEEIPQNMAEEVEEEEPELKAEKPEDVLTFLKIILEPGQD